VPIEIEPEPSAAERAAILAALEQERADAPVSTSEIEHEDQ
jgi:hypothetical protein